MARPGHATDSDRLPWLDSGTAPARRHRRRGAGAITALLTVALAGAISLLIVRDPGLPEPGAPVRIDVPKAVMAPPRPAAPPPIPKPAPLAQAPIADTAPAASVSASRRAATSARARQEAVRNVPRARKAVARTAPRKAVRIAPRRWAPARSPAPRGRIVQLGAYHSPRQAQIAFRGAVRDYPYLASLPRGVVAARVGPRRRLYYRLQVGAPSGQHAMLICRAVRAMRRACIVN